MILMQVQVQLQTTGIYLIKKEMKAIVAILERE